MLGDDGRKITSVTYSGFHVGTFPYPEVKTGKQVRRLKNLSTERKYNMSFDDSTINNLVMNQKEKKQASLSVTVIVRLYPVFLMPTG